MGTAYKTAGEFTGINDVVGKDIAFRAGIYKTLAVTPPIQHYITNKVNVAGFNTLFERGSSLAEKAHELSIIKSSVQETLTGFGLQKVLRD